MTPYGIRLYLQMKDRMNADGKDAEKMAQVIEGMDMEELRKEAGSGFDDIGCLCVLRAAVNKKDLD